MKLMDVLQDFAIMSILLLISFFLRKILKFLQKYYIPSSLIAGFLGLLLGPQLLGSVSPIYLKFTQSLPQWAGVLVIVVCATQFLGLDISKVNRDALATTFLAGTIHQTQLIIGLGITLLFTKFIRDIPLAFGFMPVWGFYGGHGNAATVGVIMEEAGLWDLGVDVGVTFATIGILCGVIGGMILINMGVKRKLTKSEMNFENLPESERTGYVIEEDRKSIGKGVSNSSSIDPLALQLSVVGLVVIIGIIVRNLIIKVSPLMKNFPLVGSVLISSMVVGYFINKSSCKKYIDQNTMNRITGTALEFMISAAIATTSIQIFLKYALPILVISVLIIGANISLALFLGKRWLNQNWFETAVGSYGQSCGVLATGLMLIKVIDSKNETIAAQCISTSSTLGYIWQIPYMLIGSLLIWTNPKLVVIATIVFGVFCLLFGEYLFGRNRRK